MLKSRFLFSSSSNKVNQRLQPPAKGNKMSNYLNGFCNAEHFHNTLASQPSIESHLNHLENVAEASYPFPTPSKKKRNLPGNPDPDAEVVALSPRTLMATNRYVCEVCHKGFQRDQNLQLHRRGHNLPWKLKQKPSTQVKQRVYICPETNCVHHDPNRALGDLTGIKKHFCRKHGEKKWKCDKCAKRYAVQSDWKAHAKICGTREYRCDCGTICSRKDSFATHRAFCDALTDENRKMNQNLVATGGIMLHNQVHELFSTSMPAKNSSSNPDVLVFPSLSHQIIQKTQNAYAFHSAGITMSAKLEPSFNASHPGVMKNNSTLTLKMDSGYTSATALLQKAAEMGAKISNNSIALILLKGFSGYSTISMNSAEMMEGEVRTGEGQKTTVDFLGVTAGDHSDLGYKNCHDGIIMRHKLNLEVAHSSIRNQDDNV